MSNEIKLKSNLPPGWTAVEIDGETNFHIESVEMFTGNDEGEETDNYSAISKNCELKIARRIVPAAVKIPFRVRGEPGVRVNFVQECGTRQFTMTICHHKGSIFLDLKSFDIHPDNN